MARQVEWLCLSDPADYEGLGELEQHLRAAKLPYCTIAPGGSVSEQLARAQAVLVLLSADYLANNGIELDLIMQQYGQRGISVVPVLWRPAPWQDGPLSALPALPANGRAVTVWSNRDAAWMAVLDGLRCEAPLRRKRMVLSVASVAVMSIGLCWSLWGHHQGRAVVTAQRDLDGDLAELEPVQRLVGTVNDKENLPLSGARVSVLETGVHTSTDAEGRFLLETSGPPQGTVTLRIDQGGKHYSDHHVMLGTKNLGFNVVRRP